MLRASLLVSCLACFVSSASLTLELWKLLTSPPWTRGDVIVLVAGAALWLLGVAGFAVSLALLIGG